MAPTIVFVFFLSLVVRASFSLPVALDVKTVEPNSVNVLKEKVELDVESTVLLEEKTKVVQSLTTGTVLNAFESIKADHGQRIRRSIINPTVHCPEDRIPYGNQCLTKEQFAEYNDVSEGGDDYVEE